MASKNGDLMQAAQEALHGKWGFVIATFVVYYVVQIIIGEVPSFFALFDMLIKMEFREINLNPVVEYGWMLIILLVDGPFEYGLKLFSIYISRNQNARLEQVFSGFQLYSKTTVAYLQMTLYTLLWSILLIIPGIVAYLSYSMTFYIMIDNPDISGREAIELSKKMMYGYKWKYFGLQLWFALLMILSVITLFIGLLWLVPYYEITSAKFYDDIKDNPYIENESN